STATGGHIRGARNEFVLAFCAKVGVCSIIIAELRAVVEGMKLAWALGIHKLAIQSDSKTRISILEKKERPAHQHATLVIEFQELMSRDWEVPLSHVYREVNRVADYLANLSHSFGLGVHFFMYPDIPLAHWLRYDLTGEYIN
ncbi:Putative ribonuclease H protein At1g65750, partial [Linum perenne]